MIIPVDTPWLHCLWNRVRLHIFFGLSRLVVYRGWGSRLGKALGIWVTQIISHQLCLQAAS
jgi:hypothetical protein